MSNSTKVIQGFSVPSQLPLDAKSISKSESILKNLGTNEELPFTYYNNLEVFCQLEKTKWIWREVVGAETGLLTTPFEYPAGHIVNDFNYSLKKFNFFKTDKVEKGDFIGNAKDLENLITGINEPKNVIVCDGDSRTAGFTGTTTWKYSDNLNLGPGFVVHNVAIGGATLTDNKVDNVKWIVEDAFTSVSTKRSKFGANNIVVIWGGYNDMSVKDKGVNDTFESLKSYCLARKKEGWKVIVVTEPNHNNSTGEARRLEFNQLIRTQVYNFADGIADIGFNEFIGLPGTYTNTTFFFDGVHMTQAGYTQVLAVIQAAITKLLTTNKDTVSSQQVIVGDLASDAVSETSVLKLVKPIAQGKSLPQVAEIKIGRHVTDGAFAPKTKVSLWLKRQSTGDETAEINVFEAREDGTVTLPNTTNAIIDAETTGKISTTKEWVNSKIQAQLIDSTLINAVTTSSAIPSTGNIHAFGLGPGTYTNWGGLIVPANNVATLSRVSGVYAMNLTPIDLSVKLNVSALSNNINSTSTTEALNLAGAKSLNDKIAQGIAIWTAKDYLLGDEVNHLGIDWISNAATVAGDVPGTSSKWVERLLSATRVAFCLYEIDIDKNGYVLSYDKIIKGSTGETYINQYKDLQVTIDANGYALEGWDWYVRPLVFSDISKTEPLPNKIKDSFSSPIDIVKGTSHYGFPGLAVGLTGILHSVYRKGAYHTGIDGNLMYSYSKDYGKTWSDEVVFMQGGTLVSGAYQDFRDTKCLRMTNGKYIVNGFIGYATTNAGTPPNNIDYDMDRYECYSIVVTEKSDGTFDLATLDYNVIPKSVVNGYSIVAGGGLVQRGETLYYTVYSVGTGNPFNSFLIKSEDYGQTFTLVGTIGVDSNENSIAFIGDTMYSVLRGVTPGTSWLSKSEDLGVTWTIIKTFPTHWHGMFLHSMVDTVMIAGRSLAGAVRVMFIDKFGRSMLGDFYFSISGDSGYSQICAFENYVYLLYHTEFQESPKKYAIQIQKIERNKLIGLSI